jgi:predicted ATPase
VAALCERLDDLPLAVELAAECLATDTLEEVVGRLENPLHDFAPPRRGRPPHHRSLLTALRRSLDCLSDREQWCFVRLGRLPRQFPPAMAERAWQKAPSSPVDVRGMLAAFVDKSLLFVDHGPGGPCYHMQQLMHRFAAELDATEPA